jgi:hypothetical protein
MSEWYVNGICGNCACIPVCSIYNATGGVAQCKYRIDRDLYGKWIYKSCETDEALMLYHCSLCNSPSAREYSYCRECGAKMEMNVEE